MAARHRDSRTVQPDIQNIYRPLFWFHVFPRKFQWDFTRRHPYYIDNWRNANTFVVCGADGSMADMDPLRKQELALSSRKVMMLGVSTQEYPDPSIDARTTPDFEPPFSFPLASPVTHRQALYATLPAMSHHARESIVTKFLCRVAQTVPVTEFVRLLERLAESDRVEERDPLWVASVESEYGVSLYDVLLSSISDITDTPMDQNITAMFMINVCAPHGDVANELRKITDAWRQDHDISDTRRREDKWNGYLDVWDKREGWRDGDYHGREEKRLSDIAGEKEMAVSTVQGWYEAAFKLIVGHSYDPNLWAVLFLGRKVSKSKWASWRRSKEQSANRREDADGPVSAVLSGGGGPEATSEDDVAFCDLISDVKSLISRGRSNEEITIEMELEHLLKDPSDLENLRRRIEEGLL